MAAQFMANGGEDDDNEANIDDDDDDSDGRYSKNIWEKFLGKNFEKKNHNEVSENSSDYDEDDSNCGERIESMMPNDDDVMDIMQTRAPRTFKLAKVDH